MNTALRCDLFCRVIDNFGDAGVCWRLARQLAAERGWQVRLWIDDLTPLARLSGGVDASAVAQSAAEVDIRRWEDAPDATDTADIVIEAFACNLPESYVAAMARRHPAPVWINLDYLTAESWALDFHGVASPHPALPLVKYFYYPGFAAGSGGLLRERDADFSADRRESEFTVSLFCYDNPALPELLDLWRDGSEPIRCRVADGLARSQVERWLETGFPVGSSIHSGALVLDAEAFVDQTNFDRRLGACDLNFVRGEDSFVRAQWAGKPLVWHIYPQAEDAHRIKLDAFLKIYQTGLPEALARAEQNFWLAWNGVGNVRTAWPPYRAALPRLAEHARVWREQIAANGNLADRLAEFCLARL
jgi:uncharacterized repeat protein (TIGR03837 family)